MKLYFEFIQAWLGNKYWVVDWAPGRSGRPAPMTMTYYACRIWEDPENGGQLSFHKNRFNDPNTLPDLAEFAIIKSKARNYNMMCMRKFSNNSYYVAFPPKGYAGDEYVMPVGVEEWIIENTDQNWGIIKGKRAGVFLTNEDADAFKLKWM